MRKHVGLFEYQKFWGLPLGMLNWMGVAVVALVAAYVGRVLGGGFWMWLALFAVSTGVQWALIARMPASMNTIAVLYMGAVADYFFIAAATDDRAIAAACAIVGLCAHFFYLVLATRREPEPVVAADALPEQVRLAVV